MNSALEILLAVFFLMVSFRDFYETKNWFYFIRGVIALLIAALLILGHAEF